MRVRFVATTTFALMCLLTASAPSAMAAVADVATPTYQTNGSVRAIVTVGDVAYIGGDFTSVRPAGAALGTDEVPRARLAAFDLSTGALLPWNPGADKIVLSLQASADGSTIYVGGAFSHVGGLRRYRVAALDATTGMPTSWAPKVSAAVNAILVTPNETYIGGTFLSVNGVGRTRLAAFDQSGALDPAWTPAADDRVRTLSLSPDGTRVFAGGNFSSIDGLTSQHDLAVLSPTTGAPMAWSFHPSYPVFGFTFSSTTVYVAGNGSGGHLDAYAYPDGARLWSLNTDGGVQATVLIGDTLYGGGHFDNVCENGGSGQPYICSGSSVTRHKFVAVDATTGALDAWNPNGNSPAGVYAMAAWGTSLLAGGDFTKIHQVNQEGFAEFG